MRIRGGLVAFVIAIQSILFLTHFFIYKTWTFALPGNDFSRSWLKATIGVLSISFIAASLLAFRFTNPAVRTLYRIAAVWLGIVSFLFLAACASWAGFGVTRIAGRNVHFHGVVKILYAAAVLSGIGEVLNAGWTPIRRSTVRLENVPESWRGREEAVDGRVLWG